jgi:hypothetical protein
MLCASSIECSDSGGNHSLDAQRATLGGCRHDLCVPLDHTVLSTEAWFGDDCRVLYVHTCLVVLDTHVHYDVLIANWHAPLGHTTNIKYIIPGLCKREAKRLNLITLPAQLLLGIADSEELLRAEHHFNPLFTGGFVYTSALLDSVMAQVSIACPTFIECHSHALTNANQCIHWVRFFQIEASLSL